VDIAIALLSVGAALLIIVYATWLFAERLRKGEKALGFREWLKNVFEAIWGL
jgi:hypothetical protein